MEILNAEVDAILDGVASPPAPGQAEVYLRAASRVNAKMDEFEGNWRRMMSESWRIATRSYVR